MSLLRPHTRLSHGFDITHISPQQMPHAHQHNDLEMVLIEKGEAELMFGGRLFRMPIKKLFVFWAGVPHMVIQRAKWNRYIADIPLPLALQWNMPDHFLRELFKGGMWVDETSKFAFDAQLFRGWKSALELRSAEYEKIVLLEIEARLRRLILANPATRKRLDSQPGSVKDAGQFEKAAIMAAFMLEHFHEPITAQEIADTVHLNPAYATTLFRKTWGVSMHDFLVRHRVSCAEQLLLTENTTILDLSMRCGFGSVSRFYYHFRQVSGQSPHQFMKKFNHS